MKRPQLTPDTQNPSCCAGDEPASFREAVIIAYTTVLHLHRGELTEAQVRQIHQALVAHADNDQAASEQSGLTVEQIAHDRTTLNASDHLPLMLVATAAGIPGSFYFSRPLQGWPRPGHRHRH